MDSATRPHRGAVYLCCLPSIRTVNLAPLPGSGVKVYPLRRQRVMV
ncbi:hypothetical protein KCP73_26695 [Salmonella enterica subsp. enterica]|nr:hypothetical protein KCP73_26695 [Salmonella enterica subsp. enterica]